MLSEAPRVWSIRNLRKVLILLSLGSTSVGEEERVFSSLDEAAEMAVVEGARCVEGKKDSRSCWYMKFGGHVRMVKMMNWIIGVKLKV